MNRLIISFMLATLFFALIASWADSGGGIAATRLNGALTDTEVASITVDTTAGFSPPGSSTYVTIGDEDIIYTASDATHFQTLTRGAHGTETESHSDNTMVYSPSAGALNAGLGFDIATTKTDIGDFNLLVFLWKFTWVTIPHITFWSFNFLISDEPFIILFRVFLLCLSAGFWVTLAISLIQYAIPVLRR